MYWPIGTPRIYAASSTSTRTSTSSGSDSPIKSPEPSILVSHDDLADASSSHAPSPPASSAQSLASATTSSQEDLNTQLSPLTPITPATPAIKQVDRFEGTPDAASDAARGHDGGARRAPLRDPVLALRVSRTGHIFVVITATSIALWQTKPAVILALVVRSDSSLEAYGTNVNLLLRPDSAILVVHTSKGYLITYSIATDGESRVYKAHFPHYHHVQRRKQSLSGVHGNLRPEEILWGPGEGVGVRDVSVRFRMVIKVDAGIESALALDDELIVATKKPAAVQCIRWTPDSAGNQTRTEIMSRMGWVEKRVSIVEMTHDRPMNLTTWITSDGRAYAVQRHQRPQSNGGGGGGEAEGAADSKRLFKGYCFHVPQGSKGHSVRAVINARFSLIAVGCSDGTIHVYSVRDYMGHIPHSHTHTIPTSVSNAGALTALCYSPDGYCLFAGFEKGWCMWSMFGKAGSNSFGAEPAMANGNGEQWLTGVSGASWIGSGSEILMVGRRREAIWSLEMARNAVTGCYSDANVFRTVLQTPTSIMVYRGYDLPDLTSISAEPFLWHTAKIPPAYLLNQWPIRQTVISPDGRYVAVAGRRGLAHYSVNSGRWRTFSDDASENAFQVRGGMCWYQHILVAAVEDGGASEVRLYSRETALDGAHVLHAERLPAPVVLITTSAEDSLLIYTHENLLYHYIFVPLAGTVRLVQVGQIAFHGIVRSPARVRGLSWILPESQLVDGDPSQDVAVASVIFLVDGKLVLLSPTLNEEGQLKYDMRAIAQNVEYHASMRDHPPLNSTQDHHHHHHQHPHHHQHQHHLGDGGPPALRDSLWLFDGTVVKAWSNINDVLTAATMDGGRDLPAPFSVSVDFYPLSVILEKGIVLGVESDLVQRRDVNFSFFHFAIRTHLFLPEVLRFYLSRNMTLEAMTLSHHYSGLEYFSHGLEILLHRVLDEEADTCPRPEEAVLPRVLSLLSSSRDYLDIVVRCTRKTEMRQWKTLFAYLPPAQELFEESLQRGSLKTASGYLIILHALDKLEASLEQSVRVLTRAMREGEWGLCRELARFLAAMDGTGETLRQAMRMANVNLGGGGGGGGLGSDIVGGGGGGGQEGLGVRLAIPGSSGAMMRLNGAGGAGSRSGSGEEDVTESDRRTASDVSSIKSTASPYDG
ncbi:Protein RIC1 -like protein [Escovopsis weberi]|uniref:Protein RIC1-like protein n=1 Tax=Escovopsis weberi TaxID=150374 RepID=A0A0M9VVM0_ESCWE|nr:Protein RIC1 -like protein [Escovopsis weberi]